MKYWQLALSKPDFFFHVEFFSINENRQLYKICPMASLCTTK